MQRTSKPTLYQLWSANLIRLYPVTWRERYAEEMLLILEDAPPTLLTILDLFLHLCDAHFHSNLITGRTPDMLKKMRLNETLVYATALAFFYPWFMLTHSFSETNMTPFYHFIVSFTNSISCILFPLTLLFGLPILINTCWNALKSRDFLALFFCLLSCILPIVVVLSFCSVNFARQILYYMFFAVEDFFQIQQHDVLNPALVLIGMLNAFIILSATILFLFLAVRRVDPMRRVTHFLFFLTPVLPLIMAIGLIDLPFLLFPLMKSLATPPLDYSERFWYLVRTALLVLVMVMTFILSLRSFIKTLQARRLTRLAI